MCGTQEQDGEPDSMRLPVRLPMRLLDQTGNDQVMRWIPALTTVLWMGAIFALSSRSTIPVPPGLAAELTSIVGHLATYALLAALIWWALEPLGVSAQRRFALAVSGAVAYGLSDEWHQSFVPGRDASVLDIMVDGIGACGGLVLVRKVTWPHPVSDGTR